MKDSYEISNIKEDKLHIKQVNTSLYLSYYSYLVYFLAL